MEPSRPVSNRPDFAVDVLAANGVDATTGCYLAADLTKQGIAESVRRAADGSAVDPALLARHRRAAEPTFAPRFGVDPDDLAQAGWGVVIASDTDPSVYAALRPLLKHRRTQAAAVAESRYREFTGPEGYRPPESKQQFLRRMAAAPARLIRTWCRTTCCSSVARTKSRSLSSINWPPSTRSADSPSRTPSPTPATPRTSSPRRPPGACATHCV